MPAKPLNFLVEQPDTLLPFLLAHVKGRSRNQTKSLLAHRQVWVEGVVATRFDHPLLKGQTVTVSPASARAERPPFPILFEDDALLVVDKPAGLLTVSTDKEKDRTAYRALTDYIKAGEEGKRIFIVHRLDRDTSGLLLFAKNEELKRALQDNWDDLVLTRGYIAVVEGLPPEPSGTVRSYLHETKSHLVFSGSAYQGKEAVTRYTRKADNGRYALLDLQLETGRKNQIRVHMKDLGCPVAGDKKYGARSNPLRRLALHASTLELRRPDTGEVVRFVSHTPPTFAALLRRKP